MKIIITTIAFCISIIGVAQTNYYVSPTGSNSNNGGISTPWLTVQFGLNQLVNGDTLNLECNTAFPSTKALP